MISSFSWGSREGRPCNLDRWLRGRAFGRQIPQDSIAARDSRRSLLELQDFVYGESWDFGCDPFELPRNHFFVAYRLVALRAKW